MTGTETDLATRVQILEDRQAIVDLLIGYAEAYDLHDTEQFLRLWAPDAEYSVPQVFGNYRGHEQLLESFNSIATLQTNAHHGMLNPRIRLDGDRASGRSVIYTEITFINGDHAILWATYQDEYARIDGEWRISRREVHLDPVPQLPAELIKKSTG